MKVRAVDNSRIYNTTNQILLFAGMYILTDIIIVCFIGYAYCDWHRDNYFKVMESYADEYVESGTIGRGLRDRLYLYDRSGELVYEMGSFHTRILTEDPAEKAKSFIDKAFKGKRFSHFIWITGKLDTKTSVVYYGMPVYENNEIKYAAVLVKEIPDGLEVTVGFLAITTLFYFILTLIAIEHIRRLQKYDRLQKQYIDNVTHELKSPVASVKALAQALSDGKTAADLDNNFYYGRIMVEADKQEKLIAEILDLSKMQSGITSFQKKPTDVKGIFDHTIEKFAGRCDLLDITFEVSDTVKDLTTLDTDGTYLQYLLDIFLSNAVKYSKENGNVRLDAEHSLRKVIIRISDDGIGISKEEMKNIFDRFYRGKNARAYAGSGLGLAIANEIISGLKEKMWIESEEGKGTTVYFTVSK